MNHLNSGDVNGALEYLQYLKARFRKRYRKKQLAVLAGYIERNRHGIWYSQARDKGISIGAGWADKAGDILICRGMKLRGMWWSRKGADAVLSIRILIQNGQWDEFRAKHKAA